VHQSYKTRFSIIHSLLHNQTNHSNIKKKKKMRLMNITDVFLVGLRLTLELFAYYNAKLMYSSSTSSMISPLLITYITHSVVSFLVIQDVFTMRKNYLRSIYRDTGLPPGTFLLFTFILSFIFNLSHIPKYFSLNKFSDLFIVSFSCLSVIATHWLCVVTKRKKMSVMSIVLTLIAGFGVLLLVKEECGTADRWLLALLLFVGSIFSGFYTVFMKIFMEIRPYRNDRARREERHASRSDRGCCIEHALKTGNFVKNKRTAAGCTNEHVHVFREMEKSPAAACDKNAIEIQRRLKATSSGNILIVDQRSSKDIILEQRIGKAENAGTSVTGPDTAKCMEGTGDGKGAKNGEECVCCVNKPTITRFEDEHVQAKRVSPAACAPFMNGDSTANFQFCLNDGNSANNTSDYEKLAAQENAWNGDGDNERQEFDFVEVHRGSKNEISDKQPFKRSDTPNRSSATSNYMQTFIQSFVYKINKKDVTEQQLSDLSFMRHYLGTTGILTLLFYWPMVIIPLDALQPTFGVHGTRLLIHVVISNILSISQNILYFVLVTCRSPHFVQLSGMILQPTIICVEMLMVMTCFTKRLVGFGCIFGSLFFIR
ncbi:putative transporter, partial [Trachipleistophora hominis]